MKKISILLILLMFGRIVFSQTDLDKLMTLRLPNCMDIEYNCTQLIEKYYNSNKFDSAKIILNYWETKCDMVEPIIRTKILFSIKDNTFNESIYDSTIFYYIRLYSLKNQSNQTKLYYNNWGYYNNIQVKSAFDSFTSNLANDLLKQQKENSIEYLFCKFYSGDTKIIFSEIQKKGKYDSTKLKYYYYKLVREYLKRPEMNFSIQSGIWIPLGKANILGDHPLLGMELGEKFGKMNYIISLYLNFIHSSHDYKTMINDSIRTTNYFFGDYVGLEVEREIFRIKKDAVNILAGIGWDWFSTSKTNPNYNNSNNNYDNSINSLNLNAGLGYRYKFSDNSYLGLRAKYNFVNYKNKGGTDLSGNTITIALIYGGFLNQKKNYFLKSFNYIDE